MAEQNLRFLSSTKFDSVILAKHCKLSLAENHYIEFCQDYTALMKKSAEYNALFYIIEGGGWIETKEGNIPIEAGTICFYPADLSEEYKVVYSAGTKKVLVIFNLTLFSYRDIFSDWKTFHFMKDEMNLIPMIHEALVSSAESKQLLLPSLVTLSIAPLLQEMQDTIKEQLMNGKNYSMLFEYLDKNLYINLSLEEISNHVGLSVSTLSHNIPKRFGFTVKKYIQKNILSHVSFDLAYTEMRMKDIALKYGFSSEAYFSKWFYQQRGIRPYQYRKIRTNSNKNPYISLLKQ